MLRGLRKACRRQARQWQRAKRSLAGDGVRHRDSDYGAQAARERVLFKFTREEPNKNSEEVAEYRVRFKYTGGAGTGKIVKIHRGEPGPKCWCVVTFSGCFSALRLHVSHSVALSCVHGRVVYMLVQYSTV